MVNYSNGKIYAIKSKNTPLIYIGSTCSTLKKRLCSHKSDYKRKLRGEKFRETNSHEILKYEDVFIDLIENFPCENKKQLLEREGFFIKNIPCVNTQIQGRTMKQYREDNKAKLKKQRKEYKIKNREKINKYDIEYYHKNKNKINKKRNVKILCEICKKEISKSNLKRHQKSKNCHSY